MLRYVLCDVFTDRPFTGNQLAVFTDARGLGDAQMQALAREMNLSESAFVTRADDGSDARIRIFTPRTEVPFAGHPTLGSAFVLGGPLQKDVVVLQTGRGAVPVRLEREGAVIRFGWMDQPVPTWAPYPEPDALLAALGVGATVLPVQRYDNGMPHVLTAVASRPEVARLAPDLARLAALPGKCFSVFCADGVGVKTRMFAPGGGVNEDAATGSAAGPIAVHLVRHGLLASGTEVRIEQGAELLRPSELWAQACVDGDEVASVTVGGAAVVIGRGEIRLD